MSAAALLPLPIYKEFRALAVPWLACVTCILAIAVADSPRLFGPLAFIAYVVGTVALGALAIGHEYTSRTLSLVLTLPARRERLLATKLSVLTVVLLTLWLVANRFLFSEMPAPADTKQMLSVIPPLCALFLAPWLTMACRSAIAGTVFALTIPGVLGIVGEQVGVAKYGYGPVMDAFWISFMWFGTLGLCAVGAVMTWRMFMRLEAIEGLGQDVRVPRWLNAGNAASQLTRRNPAWLLISKELHLQHMPLALAACYALIWTIAAWSPRYVTDSAYSYVFATGTILYSGLLSMLIGSSASVGEREIGTLASQVLLPMAMWKQWAVKVSVVLALTLMLAIGLPVMLTALSVFARDSSVSFRQLEAPLTAVILLASGSLYVSSLCRSGLWALLVSIPAVVASLMFVQLVLERAAAAAYFAAGGTPSRFRSMYFPPHGVVSLFIIAGFIALALRFALINHRSADRPAKRVLMHVIVMAVFVAVGIAAGAAWQAVR